MTVAPLIVPVNPVPDLRIFSIVPGYGLASRLGASVTLFLVTICALVLILIAPLRAQLVVISTAVLELTAWVVALTP
jgi:hypothetical protein